MEICFRETCPPGSTQPSGTVFTFLVAKPCRQMPSAPKAVSSIFGTFQITCFRNSFPHFRCYPFTLLTIFLTVQGLLSSMYPICLFLLLLFVLWGLEPQSHVLELFSVLSFRILHASSGPSLPTSSSIFRARSILSCGRSFRMWCQLCCVPSSRGNLLTLNLFPGPLSP